MNKESTRYFSNKQEQHICKVFNAIQTPNSGAGKFRKGDVILPNTMLFECKTVMSPKSSISIKEDWLLKNREEALSQNLYNNCVVINFKPDGDNYYIINENLMKFLVEKIIEENS